MSLNNTLPERDESFLGEQMPEDFTPGTRAARRDVAPQKLQEDFDGVNKSQLLSHTAPGPM